MQVALLEKFEIADHRKRDSGYVNAVQREDEEINQCVPEGCLEMSNERNHLAEKFPDDNVHIMTYYDDGFIFSKWRRWGRSIGPVVFESV